MDSCDEKLTLENVDEQVEQLLARPQEIEHATLMPLARTVHNLQSIYEEDRRLEQVWTRIQRHVPTLSTNSSTTSVEEITTRQPVTRAEKTLQNPSRRSFNSVLRRSHKQSQQPFRWNWSHIGVGLVAAMILISFFTWPLWSYAFHSLQTASTQPPTKVATPQLQPPVNLPDMQEYIGTYFKILYPMNWKITSMQTKDTSSSLQTVQFRPLATSFVAVNIDVMPENNYSNEQLLHMDPDVTSGTLLNTSTVTYHGVPWTIGVVELADSTQAQMSKIEVAYSNQGVPRRIEFVARPDMFDVYSKIFDAMFASFYTQTGPVATPTATSSAPAIIPTATAIPANTVTPVFTATPTPTTNPINVKEYINQYFKILYPANWVVTNLTTKNGYRQTVQFHPSTTSSVFVNISVMDSNALTSTELLLLDPDVELGTLLSTSTVTYHGIPWTIGIVHLANAAQAQVAYTNQNVPYKIEFGAPQATFSSNTAVFNSMLASFYPVN